MDAVQVGGEPIILDRSALDNEVYISGCQGATIVISNKVKTIAVDSCKQCKIVFEGAISSLEVACRPHSGIACGRVSRRSPSTGLMRVLHGCVDCRRW